MRDSWWNTDHIYKDKEEVAKSLRNMGRASNVDYGALIVKELVGLTFLMLAPFVLLLSLFGVTLHLTDRNRD